MNANLATDAATRPLLLPMPGNEKLAQALAVRLGLELLEPQVRRFPDGESAVRLPAPVQDREVIIVCTLDRPDDKLVPLLLVAAAARDNGARRVGLVAPYLAYMRQDIRFRDGETVSARHFADWLSRGFDWLVTVDPHLHRIKALDEIYRIPSTVVAAAPAIADWLHIHLPRAVLVGPDEESAQWVADVAQRAGLPHLVLAKTRHGDREVEVSVPEVAAWRDHTPVLVDDIISTARTMIETVGHLLRAGMAAPVCVGVHAVFAQTAWQDLSACGAAQVLTCNTITHPSNRIALDGAITQGILAHL